jgi:transcriptional regulator with XRE-family HTH domain
MRGRPKRRYDPELAEKLREARKASGMSCAAMAENLGVATSTLTRSLDTNSFSADFGEQVRAILDDPDAYAAMRAGAAGALRHDQTLNAQDLQILRKIVNLMPKVEGILKNLVKRPASRRKRA